MHSYHAEPLFLAVTMLAAGVTGQIGTLRLSSTTVRSVHAIGGNHAVLCGHNDGEQYYIDFHNPRQPVLVATTNPPFGDQWFEAEYTKDFGGRLFCGYRGGGLAMMNVADPRAPVVAATDANANYHFRGMRYRAFGEQRLLYYSETNLGLAVYAVAADKLTRIWTDFANGANDANGMEVVGNHLYLFGSPDNRPGRRELKIYELADPAAPKLVNLQSAWATATNEATQCQLRVSGLGTHLLAARAGDGLDLIDLMHPAAPESQTLIRPTPGVSCAGTFSFPNSEISIAYGNRRVEGVITPWWYCFRVLPGTGLVPMQGGVAPMEITDIAMDAASRRVLVVGFDRVGKFSLLHVY